MVTDAQVGLWRQKLMEKKTQETAAATADMSVRNARAWQAGPLPSIQLIRLSVIRGPAV